MRKIDNFENFIMRDLERDIAHHERTLAKRQQSQKPPAPTSPLLQAARSRLLLAPDPADHSQQLLLTTKHSLCTQAATLAYSIVASQAGIPTIHWRGERDHDQLTRLCTGPIRSPYRQAILRFLQHSDTPQTIPDILKATSYDREAGRKMLVRMQRAGELVSPARGLYTTAQHPCLLHCSNDPPPVTTVPNVSNVSTPPSPHHPPRAHSPKSEVPLAPAVPITESTPKTHVPTVSTLPSPQTSPPAHSLQSHTSAVPVNVSTPSTLPSVPNVSTVPSSQISPPAHSPQSGVPPNAAVPVTDSTPNTHVPNVSSVPTVSNPAHSTSEVAQQPNRNCTCVT